MDSGHSKNQSMGVTIHPPLSFREGNQTASDVFTPLNIRRDTNISLRLAQPTSAPPKPLQQSQIEARLDDEILMTERFERIHADPAVPVRSIMELLEKLKNVEYFEADGIMYKMAMERVNFERAIMNLRQADMQSNTRQRIPHHVDPQEDVSPAAHQDYEDMSPLGNQNRYKRNQAPARQPETTPQKPCRKRISINVQHNHDPRRYEDKTWISHEGSRAHSKNLGIGYEESKGQMGRRTQSENYGAQLYASPKLAHIVSDDQALPLPASRQSGYPYQQDIAFAASPSSFVDQKKRQSNVSSNFSFGFDRV